MAPPDSQIEPADEKLALELSAGKKVADAATAAGMSERTAYRRLNDPAFQERIREIRRGISSRVMHLLARAAVDAVEVLHLIATSCDDMGLRVKAAASLLDYQLKFHEQYDLDERLSRLEAKVAWDQPAHLAVTPPAGPDDPTLLTA
jgi:hypothetical protein